MKLGKYILSSCYVIIIIIMTVPLITGTGRDKSENSVESHPNFQGVNHEPSAVSSTVERAPKILINTTQPS